MKKIIVANWKMNPKSLASADLIFNPIKKAFQRSNFKNKKSIVICPPTAYFGIVEKKSKNISYCLPKDNSTFYCLPEQKLINKIPENSYQFTVE